MPEPIPTSLTGRPRAAGSVSLTQVCAWTGATLQSGAGTGATSVSGVTLSSQRVRPGDLYAALPGARVHGARFVADAVAAGAVAVLTDPEGAGLVAEQMGERSVPLLVCPRPRALLGDLASRVYAEPARALTLLAVTGTQGKTTTTRLLDGALTAAGVSSAVIGTVGTRILGREVPTSLTTPEAPDLHALFAVMVEEGVRACAMEVSSHALVMGRVDGVRFDAAAFLNLGRDHLDFHRDIDDYFAAKASLFTPERAQRGVVNLDDPWGRRLLDVAQVPMVTFSVTMDDADWRAVDVDHRPDGSAFTVLAPDGRSHEAFVPLTGTFNVANALAATATAGEAGLDPAAVAASLADAGGVPGRLERVDGGQDFLAVVDYAHKPDAVAAVLASLRPTTGGRLVVVIGAGGDRDTGKRPVMGEIAARLADVVVVTDDNPRTEDPAAIRGAVLLGAREGGGSAEVVEVGERREAIRHAVALAGPGDTVVVAGKGHETGQTVGETTYPFDDRVELRAAIQERGR